MTHKFAKYFILAISALGLSALPALAEDCSAVGPDLNSFTASTVCTVTGDGVTLQFSDFVYTAGGNTQIPASDIGVSDVTTPDGPGLVFNPDIDDTGSETTDTNVSFTVTDLTPGTSIADVYIALAGYVDEDGGSTLYSETVCGGAEDQCEAITMEPSGPGTDQINLPGPVTTLTITKDVSSAANGGTASLSSFENEYSTVPEPRGVSLLLGLGLLAGFALFKRRQAAQN